MNIIKIYILIIILLVLYYFFNFIEKYNETFEANQTTQTTPKISAFDKVKIELSSLEGKTIDNITKDNEFLQNIIDLSIVEFTLVLNGLLDHNNTDNRKSLMGFKYIKNILNYIQKMFNGTAIVINENNIFDGTGVEDAKYIKLFTDIKAKIPAIIFKNINCDDIEYSLNRMREINTKSFTNILSKIPEKICKRPPPTTQASPAIQNSLGYNMEKILADLNQPQA